METRPLRIVTFNYLALAYKLLSNWIEEAGHRHVLAVTTPGPRSRPTPSYIDVVGQAPRGVDVLVTTRLRKVATPLIRATKPDLIACFTFPYRITPELCTIPTYGAVNIHPAVLPAYRGPNVMRQFYEGSPVFGVTAHWIAEAYDTGNILSQKSAPMPNEVTTNTIVPTWRKLMAQTISEGLDRAIAGDPGTPQDDTKASYAAVFTEEEQWLNWDEPQLVIQRKTTALNMARPGLAKAWVDSEPFKVFAVEVLPMQHNQHAPGTCLERDESSRDVQTADGPIRIHVDPFTE